MSTVCRGIRSLILQEEAKINEKQGIGSILKRSETAKVASLRRTFSADMSSKQWLAFQHLKKVSSSEEFSTIATKASSSSSSSDDEDEERRKEMEKPTHFDIWSSILSQKSMEPKAQEVPYIHPLVKRSSNCLSEKSLEICTESLGSETGSDGFSHSVEDEYSASEVDEEEKQEQERMPVKEMGSGIYLSRKISTPRSFPPPLSSRSRQDGRSFQMRPHRKEGRLVLEAVPIVAHKYLHAQRQGGRLVLTWVNPPPQQDQKKEKIEVVEETHDGNESAHEENKAGNEGEGEVEREIVLEMKLHQSGLMVNRLMKTGTEGVLTLTNRTRNRNPNPNPWPGEKKIVDEVVDPRSGRLLPKIARVNVYETYWRNSTSPTAAGRLPSPPHSQNNSKNKLQVLKKQPLLLKTANDFGSLVPVRRCKESRRPLLIWEPYCIPTS